MLLFEQTIYRELVDKWILHDNSGETPLLLAEENRRIGEPEIAPKASRPGLCRCQGCKARTAPGRRDHWLGGRV